MKLVTQSEFARMAGVRATTVNRSSLDGDLKPARQGTRIDAQHPAAIAFIEKRLVNHWTNPIDFKAEAAAKSPRQDIDHCQWMGPEHKAKLAEMAKDVMSLKEYTLSDLIYFFGDEYRFLEWLKSLKEMENIEAKKIKNEVARGELVRRDLVHVGVFMVMDAAFRNILGDGAKSIANQVSLMVKADSEQKEIVSYIRNLLGAFLDGAIDKMKRCMTEI